MEDFAVTKSIAGRAAVLICAATLALALGCASDKDAPVYDTAANPHGLPAQACDLIDAIEAGQLVNYDVITESFGRLYLENQELLENKHWKEIITRLGSKFHRRADELIKQGVPSYSQAAGFYMLASFSAPDDSELAKTAALFTTWKEMMEKMDYDYTPSPTSEKLTDRLDFIRCFIFSDTLERAFAEQFLVHQLLDSLVESSSTDELSGPDQGLLAYLKLSDRSPSAPVGQFTGPAVRLIAYQLLNVADGKSRLELYMDSQEVITIDYRISLSFTMPVPNDQGDVEMQDVVRELTPFTPTSRWKQGETVVATTILAHTTELAQAQIVLVAADQESSVGNSTPIDLSLVSGMPCSR